MSVAAGWQEYLPQARWYAAKASGGELTGIEPLGWLTPPGSSPALRSELATVRVAGATQTYHLLAGYLPVGTAEQASVVARTELPGLGAVDVVDVPASPSAMEAFLDTLVTTPPAGMRWEAPPTRPAVPVRPSTAEQSNSTAVAGDWLVKVLRQVERGLNPEPEVFRALAGTGAPRLHGVLSESGYDLAVISEFLPGARDGWELATEACRAGEPIDDQLAELGAALREVHRRLASAFGTRSRSRTELRDEFLARLDAAAATAPQLDGLTARLASALALSGDGPVTTQRVHGDFHLGQALWRPDGWRIIDFEGEPGAPLARRRGFDSHWRDVAGLLRSLDYARSGHADPAGEQATEWVRRGRAAFLGGYGDNAEDPSLLRAYEVDRMVYEVGYELRNRPDWVGIPLSAVEDEARRT